MEGYVRTILGGWQEIGVPFYDYHPQFDFSLVVSIRLDLAERLIHPFTGTPSQYQDGTVTSSFRLDYFTTGQTRFTVTCEEEIRSAMTEVAHVIRNEIIPFLNLHQDVASLDMVMNRSEKPLTIPMQPYRGMHGIILAKLAGNPDFEKLVKRYLDEMESIPHQEKEKFIKLTNYLRKEHVAL
jgi:hypothetical protein